MCVLRLLRVAAEDCDAAGRAPMPGRAARFDAGFARLGLARELTDSERAFIRALDDGPTEQQVTGMLWAGESAGTLMWALGLVDELPPAERPFDGDLLDRAPLPDEIPAFVRSARLRPDEELLDAREVATMWLWRARTRWLAESGEELPRDLPFASQDALVRTATAAIASDGRVRLLDGDFEALGKPYRDLSRAEHALAHSVATERLHALSWVTGLEKAWRR